VASVITSSGAVTIERPVRLIRCMLGEGTAFTHNGASVYAGIDIEGVVRHPFKAGEEIAVPNEPICIWGADFKVKVFYSDDPAGEE
jgi:hypothetical protein